MASSRTDVTATSRVCTLGGNLHDLCEALGAVHGDTYRRPETFEHEDGHVADVRVVFNQQDRDTAKGTHALTSFKPANVLAIATMENAGALEQALDYRDR